jgi:hypothetical protein
MRWTSTLWMVSVAVGCGSERNLFDQVQTDTWAQAPTDEVDILWVIDDSGSMAEEQASLIAGFASFAQQLDESGTRFQIGVITTSFDYTDPDRGVLIGEPPILTPADDYRTLFPQRTTVGTAGSDKEKGLEAAVFALHPTMTLEGGPNQGFVREDAQLLVVIVSDEEDCSDEGVLEGQPPEACYTQMDELPPVQHFLEDLQGLKDDSALVQVGAIVGLDQGACVDVYPGQRYMAAAALTGGVIGDICETQWNTMLTDLGLVATGISTRFQTSRAAKPETLEVHVDDTPVAADATDGWTYDEATWFLEFHGASVPPRGSSVTATYTVQPGVPAPVASSR